MIKAGHLANLLKHRLWFAEAPLGGHLAYSKHVGENLVRFLLAPDPHTPVPIGTVIMIREQLDLFRLVHRSQFNHQLALANPNPYVM